MRLEGDVIEVIRQLGGTASPEVGPQQFLGLELNPRAAVIAELVLWIGWLRWRMQNDPEAAPDPVLKQFGNINFGGHAGYDAVLRHKPTGEADTDHPMIPAWPEADFIVGNPPFIGGQDLREELGNDYAEALWKANPRVPKSADFVMHWWDRAAHTLVADRSPLIRFGFVTTNSITQTFSRRVIEHYLAKSPSPSGEEQPAKSPSPYGEGLGEGSPPSPESPQPPPPTPPQGGGEPAEHEGTLSLILAIPDHPWIKPPKAEPRVKGAARKAGKKKPDGTAAVRIAMTVAARGAHFGRFVTTSREAKLDTDKPEVDYHLPVLGRINADLTTGTDVTKAVRLLASTGICHDGVKLHGKGFSITRKEAEYLGLGRREGLETFIRPYRNGKDINGRNPQEVKDKFVIDLFGQDGKFVRQRFPEVAEHLLRTVKIAREEQVAKSGTADARAYLESWWLMGKPRPEMRPALAGLPRYVGTVDTAKHRLFQFLPAEILCDDGVVVIADDSAFTLGVVSSDIHYQWTAANCGLMGVATFEQGHRYFKTQTFDPFPFPDATPAQRAVIADLAEELDKTRKEALAEVPGLTMTEIYNLRDRQRAGALKDLLEIERAAKARAGIVNRLHEQLDAAVAAAYGWPADLPPAEVVTRLVALNAARAAEEAAGTIRWLRPEYQKPRFGGA